MSISANDVKQKGVSLFDTLLQKRDELIINFRGKDKYVVMDIERYKEFRTKELDLAYIQTMQDIETGRVKKQTAKEHIEEITRELRDSDHG